MDDDSAVSRLKCGDIGGLEWLVEKHQIKALRVAYLITRDLQSAQEVVQQASLNAYQRIDHLDPGRPFAPWFFRSVINLAITTAHEQER
ncbi:MAG: sigma factor [Anaerolineaceae bacterium]|nr:sigma factor [Anaerolineaceae bacterium]